MSISDDDGSTWSIVARNLPEHATNPIHTDVGAQAAGFERALVAGVTTYAYAVHPLIDRWGAAWVSGGMASLRLRSPVFDGDVIRFPTRADDGADEGHVSAHTPRQEAAHLTIVANQICSPGVRAVGETLTPRTFRLTRSFGSDYAFRTGDTTDWCAANRVVHPAVWPALANEIFHEQLVRGSWIHTASTVRHHALVPDGATATVATTVTERFQRGGHRARARVEITVDDALVASVVHEAIIDLSPVAAVVR